MRWPFYLPEANHELCLWVRLVVLTNESEYHFHVREFVETPLASKMNAHRDTIHDFPPLNKLFVVIPLSATNAWNLREPCFQCHFRGL